LQIVADLAFPARIDESDSQVKAHCLRETKYNRCISFSRPFTLTAPKEARIYG
jgi:hypothetical protein